MADEGEGAWRRSPASSPCSSPKSFTSEPLQTGLERVAERGFALVHKGVRDVRHQLVKATLAVRETSGQKVRGLVEGLIDEDALKKSRTEATSKDEAPERWWHKACEDAHRAHRLDEDPPEMPGELAPGCHGWLEAEFLSVEPSPPLVSRDGQEATAPVCQLSLDGRNTGMLCPADFSGLLSSSDGEPLGSVARFAVQEVAGTDLRVNIFDYGSAQFRMGFEDQAFCGGAFVPLSALIKHSTGSPRPLGLPMGKRFETRLQLALLPLWTLRTRRKLEPAELTGAKRPQQELGRIHLRLSLTLRARAASLLARAPPPPATRPAARPPVGDAAGVLRAAGATAARIGRACSIDSLALALDELREELAPAITLYLWWSWMALAAPLWLWPLLLTAILPLVSWKFGAILRRASLEQPWRLYVDEVPSSGQPLTPKDHVQKAVKDVIHAQLTLMQLVESCNRWASQVERVKLLVAMGDPCVSLLFGLMALAAATSASIAMWGLVAWGGGAPRFVAWLAGSCVLLPQRARDALWDLADRTGLLKGNSLSCFCGRALDSFEARHLGLFERYTLIGARRGSVGAPPRPMGEGG